MTDITTSRIRNNDAIAVGKKLIKINGHCISFRTSIDFEICPAALGRSGSYNTGGIKIVFENMKVRKDKRRSAVFRDKLIFNGIPE